MKYRHRTTSTLQYLLVLPVFFLWVFFSSCGIPTYLQSLIIDNNLNWTDTSTTEDTLAWTLSVSGQGLGEIVTKVDDGGPGIKFFYTITQEASNSTGMDTSSVSITSLFNNYFKGSSGSGLDWTKLDDTSAPGFYIFEDSSNSIDCSLRLGSVGINSTPLLLVGTFALADVSNPSPYVFNGIPEMDVALPHTTGSVDIEISVDDLTNSMLLETTDDTGTNQYYMKGYAKQSFPVKSGDQYSWLSGDEPYHAYLSEGTPSYVHIWASLFGGRGDFNNTYWSSLQYLGNLKLF